jgi:iron complex outermembrane receptor protein
MGASFAAGLGVFTEGERPGDLGNTFILPGYARVDAMAQYTFRVRGSRVAAQLNVDNVFDTEWYAGVYKNSRDFIMPGTPRAFRASVRLDLWTGE